MTRRKCSLERYLSASASIESVLVNACKITLVFELVEECLQITDITGRVA